MSPTKDDAIGLGRAVLVPSDLAGEVGVLDPDHVDLPGHGYAADVWGDDHDIWLSCSRAGAELRRVTV